MGKNKAQKNTEGKIEMLAIVEAFRPTHTI